MDSVNMPDAFPQVKKLGAIHKIAIPAAKRLTSFQKMLLAWQPSKASGSEQACSK